LNQQLVIGVLDQKVVVQQVCVLLLAQKSVEALVFRKHQCLVVVVKPSLIVKFESFQILNFLTQLKLSIKPYPYIIDKFHDGKSVTCFHKFIEGLKSNLACFFK
jgi:hypothetical protein